MPLPDGGGAWPPPAHQPVLDKITEWGVWYSGDPHDLAVWYGGETGNGYDSVSRARLNRPSQYRGGVQGALARWWWGQPIPVGERRTKVHIPIAGDLSSTMSELLFSEPPTVTVEDGTTQDYLDEGLGDTFFTTLLEAGEVCAGLGGAYLRNVWDGDIETESWIDVVHADAAIPEWRHGRLRAVTFWRILHEKDNTVVRHLERHEPGAILHGVYEGTPDELGHPVPLTDWEQTADLADALTDGDRIETGIPMLTVDYVPNRRPNRIWRNQPQAVHLGRSSFADSVGLMDALDETWSSLMRDIRLSKARMVVPGSYLQVNARGQGATFLDREIYEGVESALPGDGGLSIQTFQADIRVEKLMTTADGLVQQILRNAGLAAQTFGLNGEVAATATEVQARERRSFITRDRGISYWRPMLRRRIEAKLALDVYHFGAKVSPDRPTITFGDSVSESQLQLATTAELLFRSQSASRRERVKLVHPDWDEDQINDEIEEIREEFAEPEPVADPFDLQPDGAQGAEQVADDEGQTADEETVEE